MESPSEYEVLLAGAAARLRADSGLHLAQRMSGLLDLDRLFVTADWEGLVPLFYDSLSIHVRGCCPRPIMDRLRTACNHIAARNLFLSGELINVLALLEHAGIEAVPFKGPALAAGVYGNVALRQFEDLDVFVRPQDVLLAKKALIDAGYHYERELTASQERSLLRSRHHLELVRDNRNLCLELHWRFSPQTFPVDLDINGMLNRLGAVNLCGTNVPSFAPADLLLILCVHGANHCWGRLEWITSVAELIRQNEDWNWEGIFSEAARANVCRIVYLGLYLAHDMLGVPLPDHIVERSKAEPQVVNLAAYVRNRFLSGTRGQPGFVEQALFHTRSRERFRDRVRHVLGLFTSPTPDDFNAISLPAILSPLYYVIRAARLLGNYGISPLMRKLRATG